MKKTKTCAPLSNSYLFITNKNLPHLKVRNALIKRFNAPGILAQFQRTFGRPFSNWAPSPKTFLDQSPTAASFTIYFVSVLLVVGGAAVYPVGWDNREVRESCGNTSHIYRLGQYSTSDFSSGAWPRQMSFVEFNVLLPCAFDQIWYFTAPWTRS